AVHRFWMALPARRALCQDRAAQPPSRSAGIQSGTTSVRKRGPMTSTGLSSQNRHAPGSNRPKNNPNSPSDTRSRIAGGFDIESARSAPYPTLVEKLAVALLQPMPHHKLKTNIAVHS